MNYLKMLDVTDWRQTGCVMTNVVLTRRNLHHIFLSPPSQVPWGTGIRPPPLSGDHHANPHTFHHARASVPRKYDKPIPSWSHPRHSGVEDCCGLPGIPGWTAARRYYNTHQQPRHQLLPWCVQVPGGTRRAQYDCCTKWPAVLCGCSPRGVTIGINTIS